MRRYVSVIMALVLCMSLMVQAVHAESTTTKEAPKETTKEVKSTQNIAEIDLNLVKVLLNNKVLDSRSIVYKNRVYLSLRDMCFFLNSGLQFDQTNKIVEILPGKGGATKDVVDKKAMNTAKIKTNIANSPYNLRVDGVNTYLESIVYENITYVPVRYFAEIFNKKVDWDAKQRKVLLTDLIEEIVGSVNAEKITQQEYDYLYQTVYHSVYGNGKEPAPTEDNEWMFRLNVQNLLIEYKVLQDKAKKEKISLTEQDYASLNSTLGQIASAYGGIEGFREFLREKNIYFNQVVNDIKTSFVVNKLQDKIINEVSADSKEVKQYYDEHASSYNQPKQVRVKHILLLTQNKTEDEKKAIKKKAEDLISLIKAGGDFDKIMNENTEDPGTQQYPTGYTFAQDGSMVKPFEDAAFSLEVGKVSDLVETEYGYHILKLEEIIPAGVAPFEQVKETVKQQYITNLLKKWRTESDVVNKMK